MPQLVQLPDIFWSQLFWLAVVFGLLFFVVGMNMLPKIEATVDMRDARIAEDLAAAERARTQADETEADYRSRIDASRAEALRQTQASKADAALEAEAQIKAADEEIGAKTRAGEERIQAASAAAMKEIEGAAVEIAQDLVAKFSGVKVTKDRAAKAVKAAING